MKGLVAFLAGLGLVVVPAAAIYFHGGLPQKQSAGIPVTAPGPGRGIQPVVEQPQHSPPEPPTPAQPVGTQAMLERAVTNGMQGFSGSCGIVVQDLTSGEQYAKNGTAHFHPASTIKLPVALYALEQKRNGQLRWNDLITYTEADFESPGGGTLETAAFGSKYPVANLIDRALTYSNNIAVNMLGRHLGWNNIRSWTRSIDAELFRLPDASPDTTPLAELGWWMHLYKLSKADPASAELVLGPLHGVDFNGRIAAGLPQGVPYLHKFGSYDGNHHDTGIIYGSRPYALIIMTNGAPVDEADAAIARVTQEIHLVMN